MITKEKIRAAESLIKNLMWLERANPLANHMELLRYARKQYQRVEELYQTAGDYYENEVAPFKTLRAALRYVIECEIDAAAKELLPAEVPLDESLERRRERRLTTLGRGNKSCLSLPMARGKSGQLGGGSKRIQKTA